jgi:hypothetical protein
MLARAGECDHGRAEAEPDMLIMPASSGNASPITDVAVSRAAAVAGDDRVLDLWLGRVRREDR